MRSRWVLRGLFQTVVRVGAGITRMLPPRLWFRILGEARRVKRMDYGRHPIYMCVDSWIENDVRLRSCNKEPGTVEWIENWFRSGDVFYDIGANTGAYSLVAFRFLSGKAKIYSFEPGFVTFPQLCKNIHLNRAGEAIVPLQVALSDRTSLGTFQYQNLLPGGALHALGPPLDHLGREFRPVLTLPTLSFRLDDFVREFALPVPNHMKIDVDGTEGQIIKGGEEILGRGEVRTILVELNEKRESNKEIGKFLEKMGFFVHSRRDENILFCRRNTEP